MTHGYSLGLNNMMELVEITKVFCIIVEKLISLTDFLNCVRLHNKQSIRRLEDVKCICSFNHLYTISKIFYNITFVGLLDSDYLRTVPINHYLARKRAQATCVFC